MSFNIEISDDTASALFRDILVQDYKDMVYNIKKAEDNLENLAPYEFEDLVAWRRWREALGVMLEFYLAADEREAILSETTNRK